MKKYYLADVLTATQVVLAVILAVMTVVEVDAGYAMIVFVLGELCDAFDGICARRWPYPEDGKRRWWRVHAEALDQISDIMLGVAGLAYITFCVHFKLGATLSIVTILIGAGVQAWVYSSLYKQNPKLALKVVLIRRLGYVAAVVWLALIMLWTSSFHQTTKIVLTGLGLILCAILWVVKEDRRMQDKTPPTVKIKPEEDGL